MRFETRLVVIVLGVLAVAWAMLALPGRSAEKAAAKARWEYKVVTDPELRGAGGLSKMGDEGWELVAVEPAFSEALRVDIKFTGNVFNVLKGQRTFYFKRAK
jgi:hypothetical protein